MLVSSTNVEACSSVEYAGSTGTFSRFEDLRIVAAMEEYVSLVDGGQPPARSEFLARHASIAEPLGACLAGMDLVDEAAWMFQSTSNCASAVEAPPTFVLGDFRIIREIGRGGMGVVYEAEQRSLGRRVALKVLPSAASMDPRQRQRFQIEAQAAALLHHEHIVPVFGIGTDRGAHFYAMQLIEGKPLTRIIRELAAKPSVDSEGDGSGLAGERARRTRPPGQSSSGRAHGRETARLGLQAAEALEHAHMMGVIHRDIKPSNLLIDGRGSLWIADFGLARLPQEDLDLTRTGDLVGTLRYMSPEQIRAERGGVNAATDIYSLGVTLYELLTLRPAFDAADREELVKRILDDEPAPLRRINPAIPKDLETIVLKAVEKVPSARYASAGSLADDLRRFLNDEPIRARRPGLVDRAIKWSRRHRPAVVAGLAALILTLTVSTTVLWAAKRRTDATLDSNRKALVEERLAIEYSLGALDQITRPLAASIGSDPTSEADAKRVLLWALSFYDRVPKLVANAEMLKEVYPKAYRQAGFCRMALGRAQGRDDYREAIRHYEQLAASHPEQIWLRTGLIETLYEYSRFLKAPADGPEAEATFRRALAVAEAMIADTAVAQPCFTTALVGPLNDLAWALVLTPDVNTSDAEAAARLIRHATEWEPRIAGFWNTLGVAQYRLGHDASAAAAFQKSMDLNNGGDPADWLFLAALDHRTGSKEQARLWFDQSIAWMDRNRGKDMVRDAELARFRDEIAGVTGLK
ncbi:protein kinase domain-containing protein [Paludisphaera borealis]|nr:serine/threonine-protein kinase [Paludisphaera borealis]